MDFVRQIAQGTDGSLLLSDFNFIELLTTTKYLNTALVDIILIRIQRRQLHDIANAVQQAVGLAHSPTRRIRV